MIDLNDKEIDLRDSIVMHVTSLPMGKRHLVARNLAEQLLTLAIGEEVRFKHWLREEREKS